MTTEDTGNTAASSAPPDDEQAVLEDIARTREQLGETVAALTAKADVKARRRGRSPRSPTGSRARPRI